MFAIRKSAIQEFLTRKRADFNYYKELTNEELEARKNLLPVEPPIWDKLLRPQKICFIIGARLWKFAFHLKVGMGKTLVSIALIRYFIKLGKTKCVLVLVPTRSNKHEWADELGKHSPETSYCVLEGSTEDKWRLFERDKEVFIATYAGLYRMVCTKQTTEKGNKFKPDAKLLKKLAKIDGLILDESTKVSNQGSLFYRVSKFISKQCNTVFALSGTPFGRDPTLLWSQLNIIDGGEALGETLGLFRAAFFNARENYWGGMDYKFKPNMMAPLNKLIAHSSISIKPNPEDLPQVTRIIKEARLPDEASNYYTKAKKMLYNAGKNPLKVHEAFVRMRQISSGFLGYKDDETRGQVYFSPNAKLELLMGILKTMDFNEDRVIIFYEFIPSGELICKELKAMKLDHVKLAGGMRDPEGVLHAFKDGKVPILVMSNSAGGLGLNLQVASHGLVYESPVSVIMREQIEARFIRQFSTWQNVFLYDLVSKGTADRMILDFARQGRDLMKAIVDGERTGL